MAITYMCKKKDGNRKGYRLFNRTYFSIAYIIFSVKDEIIDSTEEF